MKKLVRILIWAGIIFLVVYSSITIQPLSDYKLSQSQNTFDAKVYAEGYWESTILPRLETGFDLDYFLNVVGKDRESAFYQYGNSISIGSLAYFLVTTQGRIENIEENVIVIQLINVETLEKLTIAVEFIYGNAARDVFGAIDLNDFESTSDLNKVSEELNKIIKLKVVSPFLKQIQEGDLIEITGVLELNSKFLTLNNLEIIPLKLSIVSYNKF
jgi:predicted lipoprotein